MSVRCSSNVFVLIPVRLFTHHLNNIKKTKPTIRTASSSPQRTKKRSAQSPSTTCAPSLRSQSTRPVVRTPLVGRRSVEVRLTHHLMR